MKKPHDDASDAEEFETAMEDVVPLPPDPRGKGLAERSRSKARIAPASSTRDDPGGTLEEFAVPGVDRRELGKLKGGRYKVEARLDLHGQTADEACASTGRFVEQSRNRGCRCICIVHGRGLNSEGNVPILKVQVRAQLRTTQSVLAYSDAPRTDGGPGAVYVLLRR